MNEKHESADKVLLDLAILVVFVFGLALMTPFLWFGCLI